MYRKSLFNFGSLAQTYYKHEIKCNGAFGAQHEWKSFATLHRSCSSKKKFVLGCGSNVVDQMFRVKAIPNVGEKGFFQSPVKTLEKSVVGGVTLNHLSWASLLGVPTGLLALHGKDSTGRMIRKKLLDLSVTDQFIQVDDNFVSAESYVFVQEDGERSIIMAPGATSLIDQNAVRKYFESAIINYASMLTTEVSQVPLPGVIELLKVSREHNIPTVVDFDVAPSVAIKEAKLGNIDQLKELLKLCNVLKPAKHVAKELMSLLKPHASSNLSPSDLAKYLLEYSSAQLVVITNGKQSSVLATHNSCIEVKTEYVEKVVDATGAGDAFLGGLIAGLHYNGFPDDEDKMRKLCEVANIVASANLMVLGGLPEKQSRDYLQSKLEAYKYKIEPVKDTNIKTRELITTSELLERSISQDINALTDLNESIDVEKIEAIASRLMSCKGNVFTTGIGKSGIVGQRVASSLSSIGIVSCFVHTSEWMHGELGKLHGNDIVLCISHSGNTNELLQALDHIKKRDVTVLSIVGFKDCKVSLASDECICYCLSPLNEPLGGIPSTSIVLQEAVVNALVSILITKKTLTRNEFHGNHPGGTLGKLFSNK